ncbi:MAG: recombination protein RecR [Chloroflexi bacterium RBG_16_64_43]|nr:MAG: recombination protein RecR [Chloroflexi bacterium RBG_16_64_43]
MTLPRSVARLNEELMRLPGIGPKTAARLAYYLLRAPENEVRALGEALLELRSQTRFCSECFTMTDADVDPCAICRDEARDRGVLCVVEAPLDVEAIERTQEYRGRYHVLHGAISPVEGVGPEHLRIRELLERIDRGGVQEVIFATNASLEGEATAMYLRRQLEGKGLRLTRLARGLPVGGDLEYADETTLARAIAGRSDM